MDRLSALTVNDLKDMLRVLGLSTTGNKSELVARLGEVNNIDDILISREKGGTDDEEMASNVNPQDDAEANRRMVEIYKKEKELVKRELAIVRLELEMARATRGKSVNVTGTDSAGKQCA